MELDSTYEKKEEFPQITSPRKFSEFLGDYIDEVYNIEIEGYKYSIPVRYFIQFIILPNIDFEEYCTDNIKIIEGIPKAHFVFAARDFFYRKDIFNHYNMPQSIIDRYKDICTPEKIDYQTVGILLETEDTLYKNIKLNPELEIAVRSGMPDDFTKLEKAIYVYIKLCKFLTYDDEFFAVNQKGASAEKHKDLNYISSVTPTNNKVVCFEFNLIFSKFLDRLGLKFMSDYKDADGEEYGESHVDITFRDGKFLVTADSVRLVLYSDMVQAKLNQPLLGLKCLNVNEYTKKQFKEMITKVYELVAEEEKLKSNDYDEENINIELDKKPKVEHIENYEEIVSEYVKSSTNIKSIPLNEKISILIEKVKDAKVYGTDALAYIMQLRKILFNDQERTKNISVCIVRNNAPVEPNSEATVSMIFSVNNYGFRDFPAATKYFYFEPDVGLIPYTFNELQSMFDDGVFTYINEMYARIPGIIESGGRSL